MAISPKGPLNAIRINRRIRNVLPSATKSFGALFEESRKLKTFVLIGKKPILSVNELVREIESRKRNGETLELIRKSLCAINAHAMPDRYSSELHLEKLISDLDTDTKDFFLIRTSLLQISSDTDRLLSRLREAGILERKYHSPMELLHGPCAAGEYPYFVNKQKVETLTQKWFEELIENAHKQNIRLTSGTADIRKHEDLASFFLKNLYADDGRLMMFLIKAIQAACDHAKMNSHLRLCLDLDSLVQEMLQNRIDAAGVDEIIDCEKNGMVKEFLESRRVLSS